jgi:hypothetical protein
VEKELQPFRNTWTHPPNFSGVRVTRSLVLYVCFVDRCLSFCPFSFGHRFVCPSSIYGFWLPLWYLQTLFERLYNFTKSKSLDQTKDRVTQTQLKTGDELRCSGRVSSSCSTSGPKNLLLVKWWCHASVFHVRIKWLCICMFCRSLFVLLSFFFWPSCCLSFFDLRILITPVVSSNSFWTTV